MGRKKGIFLIAEYQYPDDDEHEDPRYVVPTANRVEVIFKHHDTDTVGHYGIEVTTDRIRRRYFWPAIKAGVTEYILSVNATKVRTGWSDGNDSTRATI